MESVRRRRRSSASSDETLRSRAGLLGIKSAKIRYAKKKKPDGPYVIGFQIFCVFLSLLAIYYTYYHFDHFHFHLANYFATKWDDHHAQHILGHKLLKNDLNSTGAFHWFRKSAEKGHPQSAYNLAAGHLSGYRTDVEKGEVKKLLKFAAKNGVEEARLMLQELCKEKPKYCEH